MMMGLATGAIRAFGASWLPWWILGTGNVDAGFVNAGVRLL